MNSFEPSTPSFAAPTVAPSSPGRATARVSGSATPEPATTLLRLADEVDEGIRSRQYRSARQGELVRLAPGSYVPADEWTRLGPDARYRLVIRAALERVREGEVLSHWSAAALWRLPIIGSWPATVHVTAPIEAARRSTTVLRRHRRHLADVPAAFRGTPVTSLAETVIDMARVAPFATAVAMGDAALRRHERPGSAPHHPGVSTCELERVVAASTVRRGAARARRVLDFVDGRADRPGESLSRVTMHLLGVPTPVLQHRVVGPTGKVYYLDFYWPEQNIGADFDGRIKYTDPAFRGGRTADEVVYDEKLREDEVRLDLDGYGRWDWQVAGSQVLLASRLRRIGLRW